MQLSSRVCETVKGYEKSAYLVSYPSIDFTRKVKVESFLVGTQPLGPGQVLIWAHINSRCGCLLLRSNVKQTLDHIHSKKAIPVLPSCCLHRTFKKSFTYLFLERGEGKERGRETSMCGCLSRVPYRGHDLAHNPGVCPDWELNWRPFGLQAGAQSAESHQPGLLHHILKQLFKSELAFLITDKSFFPKIDSIS